MIKKIKFTSTLILALLLITSLLACQNRHVLRSSDPLIKAYEVEQDSNDPPHTIALNYQQTQGKRIFYNTCVWCHADTTPAGPSNRSNLTPTPPLINDGAIFNTLSDEALRNTITFGGDTVGKSPMMPPWGRTLSPTEVNAVITYIRAVAQPAYQPAAQRYSEK